MITEAERDEYLAEIRREVCSHCKEKPEGGRPLWHGIPLTWQPLFNAIKDAAIRSAGDQSNDTPSPKQA